VEAVPDPVADPTGFVRATQADVWRFTAGLVDPATADDLTQETYLRAFRGLGEFAGRSSARTWLLSVARHTAIDAIRSSARRPRTDGAEDWETRADAARRGSAHSAAHEAVLLRALVTALDPDRRDAFVLTQLLDLSYAEAADVCGCPVGTIRSRVARAREDLVAALEDGRGARPRRADHG
jgi:RNA polymerase sigma-70 factor (ECF subfamily)